MIISLPKELIGGLTMDLKNHNKLINNGETLKTKEARRIVLDGISQALLYATPVSLLKKHVKLEDDTLIVDNHTFQLSHFDSIYLIGAGKASGYMAEYMESLLGEWLTSGWINILEGTRDRFKVNTVVLHEAAHPNPDIDGLIGAQKIAAIADDARSNDLIIFLLSGGGSALLPLPRNGITLDEQSKLAHSLMLAGANITHLNTVRKHLSNIKGGWLAKRAYPAHLLSLILSDVVGDPLSMIASGPTVADETTFNDAIRILNTYNVWKSTPTSIKTLLEKGKDGLEQETPQLDDPCFNNVTNIIVGSNRDVCSSLVEYYRKKKLTPIHLTSFIEGEAKDAGLFYSALIREVAHRSKRKGKPTVLILGGETTVTVKGEGKGGRNQESMLSASLKIREIDGIACASIGTDGLDGPTDAAGALIDGFTCKKAQDMTINPELYLSNNNSYFFFKALGDLIFTGPTGTNVNDIIILVIT